VFFEGAGKMKVLTFVLLPLAVFSLLLGSCGEDESDCDKADNIRGAALNEICATKGDECCICKCWNDSNQEMDTETPCTCKAPTSFDCTGDVKAAAQVCLAAEETCRQGVKDQIELACPTQ
jgi:hypothetical protein